MVDVLDAWNHHSISEGSKGLKMPGKRTERRIRAYFREWARDLIRRDRLARKLGRSQDTIREIERALVEAFRLGQNTIEFDAPDFAEENESIVDWIEISPRARDVLSLITYRLHAVIEQNDTRSMLERVTVGGKERWRSVANRDRADALTYSAGAVNPLLRLGLLEPIQGNPDMLVLTQKGVRTADEYWRRREAEDRSLPIESVRV